MPTLVLEDGGMIETKTICDRCGCEIYQAEYRSHITAPHDRAVEYHLCTECTRQFLDWTGKFRLRSGPKWDPATRSWRSGE